MELALWSLGCAWPWLLSPDLIPTLSCSLPSLISDLPYHNRLACIYGSLTTPGCHPQDLCPCLTHPLYPVGLPLPAWNNLPVKQPVFSAPWQFLLLLYRECCISQLRCIFQSKCALSLEDEWPALCLPPTFLLLFPAITSFCHTSSAASLAFSLNSLMLSKEIHKFVQRRGNYLPIWMCKGGRRRREWTLAFWWQWSTTLAALQQQLLLQFPYFIAIFSSLTAWGYHLILNLATPHLPL